ncbi:hypothetical protein MKK68_03260 [Methylobacterium sp. E-016]|uniref:hypothetical protein n=1 Tax=unclassified Methylobacterium TaxID=2615210 RepID=UPI001FB99308|nr:MULTISPECIES: hypothetical protein [unclassified Methylobacterium]MCJ2074673.1 hypothetical protein [Methylobacterium sp. E-016]
MMIATAGAGTIRVKPILCAKEAREPESAAGKLAAYRRGPDAARRGAAASTGIRR